MEYWSIGLHKKRIQLSSWCQYRSRKKQKLSCAGIVTRAKAFGVEIDLYASLEIADIVIEAISKEIKTIRNNSEARRMEFQLLNVNNAEDLDDRITAKIIRSMVNTETKARAFRKYKSMVGGDRSSLSRLEVPASWPNSTTFDEDTSILGIQNKPQHGEPLLHQRK